MAAVTEPFSRKTVLRPAQLSMVVEARTPSSVVTVMGLPSRSTDSMGDNGGELALLLGLGGFGVARNGHGVHFHE